MKDIRRYNSIMNLSKFTFDKKILNLQKILQLNFSQY